MLYYNSHSVVLEEVPNEISLALSISGCSLMCEGCHSSETRSPTLGSPLTETELLNLVHKHKHISCVLFYGGEWDSSHLLKLLIIVQSLQLKSCLYTGLELSEVPTELLSALNYIKVGRYIAALGGLSEPTTNQKFITLH